MAELKLNIPDEHAARVVHALCVAHGLEESPGNAKQAIIQFIRATVRNVEQREAEQAALDSVVEPDTEGIVG